MNFELICWIFIWFLITELLFILATIVNDENKDEYSLESNWMDCLCYSILLSTLFMFIQWIVVSEFTTEQYINYFNLVYELLIIIILTVFFYINKKISNKLKSKLKSKLK